MHANYLLQQLCFSFIQFSFSHSESVQRIKTRKKKFFWLKFREITFVSPLDLIFYSTSLRSHPYRLGYGTVCTIVQVRPSDHRHSLNS